MKKLTTIALTSLLAVASNAQASGYRIPEQSVNSTATSAAYTAKTYGADTTYFNPANMSYLADGHISQVNLMTILLSDTKYQDNNNDGGADLNSNNSESDIKIFPQLFYISPKLTDQIRVGFSTTVPAGLSKIWKTGYGKVFAEEFTLRAIEANPTMSYHATDYISFGLGLRMVYADGIVKSDQTDYTDGYGLTRDMTGRTIEYGYNVAATIKPMKNLNLAATYRSKIMLGINGEADLTYTDGSGTESYSSDAGVKVPLPAVLALATSYTIADLTVELQFDRTFWSAYEDLDFNYETPITNNNMYESFDVAKAKNWNDTNAYRLAIHYQLKPELLLMAGYGRDKNPIPNQTLSFELPDSDSHMVSAGANYTYNKELSFGGALLYSVKDDRKTTNTDGGRTIIDGEFTNSDAIMLSLAMEYRF